MKVFVDNDVVVKLARWGLLERFHSHLTKQGKADVFVLTSLRYRFKLHLDDPAGAVQAVGSSLGAKQLLNFVNVCRPVKGHNQQVAAALAGKPQIDAGEATLFAAAGNFDAALVDTGDKKALRALAALSKTEPAIAALVGKLACLEQTVHYMCGRWTFDTVAVAIATDVDADAAVRGCFSAGHAAAVCAALEHKVGELAADCGALLAAKPFAWIP